MFKQNIFLL